MSLSDVWKKEHLQNGRRDLGAEEAFRGRIIANTYRLESLIGEGGMGLIFLANHNPTGKKVVVKLIRQDRPEEDFSNLTERFYREAHGMTRVSHPNIISLLDYDFSDPLHAYIAMEFVEGETMRVYIDNHPTGIPIVLFMSFMEQLCGAVATFHELGIIHRDLKPTNIMITKKGQSFQLKILDLGLIFFEGIMSPSSMNKLTQQGELVGTPAYMSPEQCLGKPINHQADIYNLGLIAYELLSGHQPFESNNLGQVLVRQIHEAPKPLDELRQDIPPPVVQAIHGALAKNPAERHGSCALFWQALFEH